MPSAPGHDTGGSILRPTHPSSIALPDTTRADLACGLVRQFAAVRDLHSHVAHASWNVRGPFFVARRELFGAVSGRLGEVGELLAERIGALGFGAPATSRMVAAESYLEPYPQRTLSENGHIAVLVGHYRRIECELRDLIPFAATHLGDPVTADLLTSVLRVLERDLWFLESHLEPGPLVELDGTAAPPVFDERSAPELIELPPISSLTH